MPENKSKTVTTMQKIMYTAGAFAAIASGIAGFKTIKKEIGDFVHGQVHEAVEYDVKRFEDTIRVLNLKIDTHIKEKESSYAIGLRAHKDGKLFYRAEDGKEYPAFKDEIVSQNSNYPYYYYKDPITDQRLGWCK
jgi:hypothetical protein